MRLSELIKIAETGAVVGHRGRVETCAVGSVQGNSDTGAFSGYQKLAELTLVRDGVFEGLGLCNTSACMLILVYLSDPAFTPYLKDNKDIGCVLTTAALAKSIPENLGLCTCDSPKTAFFRLHNRLAENPDYARAAFPTQTGENCVISPLACISDNNVMIGDNVVIEEFVSVKSNVAIGAGTIIRTGSVIGGTGYEFKADGGEIFRVTHAGGVVIGEDVEVLHNTCIPAAVFPWDNTVIGSQTKIDNLVHLAHSCKIGRRNFIVAGAVLCGSTISEDDVYIAPNATIAPVRLANGSRASLGSVVTKSVPPGAIVSGNFAIEHTKWLRFIKELDGR